MIAVIPIGAFIAAIFALLFILAWQQWGQVIVNTINVDIPIVGHVLGNLVNEALEVAYAGAVLWLDNVTKPLASAILSFIAPVENIIGALVNAVDYNLAILSQFINVGLATWTSQVASDLVNYGDDAALSIANYINVEIDQVESQLGLAVGILENNYIKVEYDITQDIAGIQAEINAGLQVSASVVLAAETAAQTIASNLFAQADADIQTAYTAATSYTNTVAQALQTDIQQVEANIGALATTAATTVAGALITDIDGGIVNALSGIYTDVDAAITDVIGIAGTDDADIIDALRQIATDIPADIPGVAALAGTTALALTRYLKECGIPNCKNLSGFGNDLQSLLGLVNDASFLGLLVDLIQHPSDASSTLTGLFGDTISGTTSAFRELVGV